MTDKLTISDIKAICNNATINDFRDIEKRFIDDERSGIQKILKTMQNRCEKELSEIQRVNKMYEFEQQIRNNSKQNIKRANNNDDIHCLSIGLDEVGRGPLAGPLAIGAVVLDMDPNNRIYGINDSKKLSDKKRTELEKEIKEKAIASCVIFISAREIDEIGISLALRKAFTSGISEIEKQLQAKGYKDNSVGVVCLDGNPMGLDDREVNIIKGDAKCASIGAASIIAKVARDRWMEDIDLAFPEYDFAGNKGYGSSEHIKAIKEHGLCPIHRKSFCKNFV